MPAIVSWKRFWRVFPARLPGEEKEALMGLLAEDAQKLQFQVGGHGRDVLSRWVQEAIHITYITTLTSHH